LPISIYLVVVLYRHKHCRPQKVELDLACRDSTTTKCKQCLQSEKYYWNYGTPMPLLLKRFQNHPPVLSTCKTSS
jgi:hypothetical protein